ncbi:MAG: 4Fe-4S binding protein [Candidatus Lokiarchaeota archaeon]
MQIYNLKINHNLCTGCNVCVVSCPLNFSQLRDKGQLTEKNAVILVRNGLAHSIYDETREINCDGCGVCLKACPKSAIKLEVLNAVED